MKQAVTTKLLDDDIIGCLASVSGEGSCIPSGFISEFEIQRLEFNKYGRLKRVIPIKNQMLIASLMLLRILIYKILLRAWEHCKVKPTELIKTNMICLCSVIYAIVMEYLRNNLKKMPNNQTHIMDPAMKIESIEPLVPVEALGQDIEPELWEVNSNEIINGLLPKEHLSTFFQTSSKWVEPSTNELLDFIEVLSKTVMTKAAQTKQDQKKARGAGKKMARR